MFPPRMYRLGRENRSPSMRDLVTANSNLHDFLASIQDEPALRSAHYHTLCVCVCVCVCVCACARACVRACVCVEIGAMSCRSDFDTYTYIVHVLCSLCICSIVMQQFVHLFLDINCGEMVDEVVAIESFMQLSRLEVIIVGSQVSCTLWSISGNPSVSLC